MDPLKLKEEIYQHCLQTVNDKTQNLNKQIELNKQASLQETKSSMGDKYETGRAMVQLELDKLNSQLQETAKLVRVLDSLQTGCKADKIDIGTLIITDGPIFFIAISLGKVVMYDKEIFVISAVSPIGKILLSKKSNDSISFMNKDFSIKAVC